MSGHGGAAQAANERFYGVVIATVTRNDDPDGLGRVKLEYPWLSACMETDWVRVAQPYAGGGYGFYWMPERHDEVLVAFMHGNAEDPVVVGGLYNGVDKPRYVRRGSQDNASEDPKVIQTKSGHRILLEDASGKQKIEIVDASGQNSVTIDTATNAITIKAQGDISVEATGQLNLSGLGGVKISGSTIELN
jgi:phage baseplate assembly protein V